MVSLSKVRARCETVRKDRDICVFALLLCVCVCFCKVVCGPVPTEMMDDGMCTHNLLTLQPLH